GRVVAPMTIATQTPTRTEAVQITEVTKAFGGGKYAVTAIDGMSVAVGAGEFLAIVGASGCGKSTLLSLVAGLEDPSEGVVDVGAHRVAMMFQEASLFPWLTV